MPRFWPFDQNTLAHACEIDPALKPLVTHTRDHTVGAFRAFDRFDDAVGDDNGLPYVVGTKRADQCQTLGNVDFVGTARSLKAQRAFADQKFGRHVRNAEHTQAARFKQADHAAQYSVIAARPQRFHDLRQRGEKAEIGFGSLERRTAHASNHDDVFKACAFETACGSANFGPIQDLMREGSERVVGLAFDHHDVNIAAAACNAACNLERKTAAARDDADPFHRFKFAGDGIACGNASHRPASRIRAVFRGAKRTLPAFADESDDFLHNRMV